MPNIESLGTRLSSFIGGSTGKWKVLSVESVRGGALPVVDRLDIFSPPFPKFEGHSWILNGVISNARYVEKAEKTQLLAKQAPLNRIEATRAALIPIKKSSAWWSLNQDERRTIFETKSHHTAEGLKYLPAISRRLFHCYDLGEPFDFLTWFEYSPEHSAAFENLVQFLRKSEEWRWVDREVDIRLELAERTR